MKNILIISEMPTRELEYIRTGDVHVKNMTLIDMTDPEIKRQMKGQKLDRILLPEILLEQGLEGTNESILEVLTPCVMQYGDWKERIAYY